jgi:hypothetical protein
MRYFCLAALVALQISRVSAIQITGYSAAANDRYSSGFPGAPIENSGGTFVGLGYDWSGVGWSSTDGTKGFGFLSPQHYLVASHYGGAAAVTVSPSDGVTSSGTQSGVVNLGIPTYTYNGTSTYDLSIGTLTAPITSATALVRYGVLDLNATSTSNSPSNYNGLGIFLTGRGGNGTQSPRVADETIAAMSVDASNSIFVTTRTSTQLETGDSGSPAFAAWTNPDGGSELALLGNNFAVSDTYNFINFLGTAAGINSLNAQMTASGFALRVVGNPASTWQGDTNANLSRAANWSSNAIPTDLFTRFDAVTATTRAITVNANTNLRGLFFTSSAASGDSFTLNGTSTLTVGRGGVTNYDEARQVVNAPVTLGDHQYWDAGDGGITINDLATNGKLLEVTGSVSITGSVSGNGSLALTGGLLDLGGNSTYTGNTWVHAGRLNVTGNITASQGVVVDAEGSLQGSGKVGSVSGSGSIDPGNSPGILTAASLDTEEGLGFNFEFTRTGSPDYGNATASGNDVLRLAGGTPFSQALGAANEVGIFFNVASLAESDVFRGGFFTDNAVPFLSSISSATILYYLANPSGGFVYNGVNYDAYSGPFTFTVSTVSETAGFASGSQSGFVMQIAVPEPGGFLLALGGILFVLLVGRTRRHSD